MKDYSEYLTGRLFEAMYARKKAERDLHYVVDTMAERIVKEKNRQIVGKTVMFKGSPYKVVDLYYCEGETYDNEYRSVVFEAFLVAESFCDFQLTSEQARVCGAALRGQVGATTRSALYDIANLTKAVIAYDYEVMTEHLPDVNFSTDEISASFAKYEQ